MNKKEAIAYAQIALDCMNYNLKTNLSLDDLELNMMSAFELYDRKMALVLAKAKLYAEKQLKKARDGVRDGK